MDTETYQTSLSEFRTHLWDEIQLNVATNLSVDREEFLEYVAEQLTEAEEIDDFSYVPYEGFGRRNRRIQIDGYSYSELDECLNVFIATPMTYDEDETLITTDANRYIGMAAAFLDNAEYIIENAEESAPGYGFATDVIGMYSDVRKYKIYLISDKIKSKTLTQLDNIQARGKDVECHVWDISRIFELTTSSMGREEIVIRFADFGIKGLPCLLASETPDYKAYLCNIPGMVLAILYNKYGGRLLEGNVRSFLQVRGKVNKGIRYTILNEPEMFFAYNNGIAATAYDMKVESIEGISYITEITSLQIVNGGQTTFNEEYYKNAVSIALLFRESDKIVRKQSWYKSYKANIVEYALAKIFYTVNTQYPNSAINLKNIWQKQILSAEWVKQIEDASFAMYQYLIRKDRGVENVTEWAKREACWKGAKELPYTLLPEFAKELQSREIAASEAKDAKRSQRQTDKLNNLVEVVNYGPEKWAALLEWNISHRVMSPSEIHQIQLAKSMDGGLITSDRKCQKVLSILKKCRIEGFPG